MAKRPSLTKVCPYCGVKHARLVGLYANGPKPPCGACAVKLDKIARVHA